MGGIKCYPVQGLKSPAWVGLSLCYHCRTFGDHCNSHIIDPNLAKLGTILKRTLTSLYFTNKDSANEDGFAITGGGG